MWFAALCLMDFGGCSDCLDTLDRCLIPQHAVILNAVCWSILVISIGRVSICR